jgi:methionine-rich copper-binding protein CopC
VKARSLLRAILIGLSLALFLLGAGPAAAHAELLKAIPEPGAVLTRSPDRISLTFNEPLNPLSTFVVFNRGFETMPGIVPAVDKGNEEQLSSTVPPVAAGTYTVQWNVIGIDGHPSSGSYSFTVLDSRIPTGIQWLAALAVLGIVALVAALVFLPRLQLLRRS